MTDAAPLAGAVAAAGRRPGRDPVAVMTFVAATGLALYPAQEEALLELMAGKHVVLNTPTGSGKSLVATALHFKALAEGKTLLLHLPDQGAGQREVLRALRAVRRPRTSGMMTGDASINRDAPIICCTAEILANMALRDGAHARRLRRHGRVPLLRRPRARHGLAGAAARARRDARSC